jgi:hypothetical protein
VTPCRGDQVVQRIDRISFLGVNVLYIFFPGKILEKIPQKIPPTHKKKCWEKLDFSAEKVSKNHFSTEFFRGKSLSMEKMYGKF